MQLLAELAGLRRWGAMAPHPFKQGQFENRFCNAPSWAAKTSIGQPAGRLAPEHQAGAAAPAGQQGERRGLPWPASHADACMPLQRPKEAVGRPWPGRPIS